MLVNLNEVLTDGLQKGYAVGAFNATNLECIMAILDAAEEAKKGIVLSFAQIHEEYTPMAVMAPILLDFAKRANIPVCVHLDHGTSVAICERAMQLGFTSVMIDASSLDYELNLATTEKVVRLAHEANVTVEGELGHVFTSSNEAACAAGEFSPEDAYTDPNMAKDFVVRTGVDALAIAFGTVHGIYTQKPVLDLSRIAAIRRKVDVPLVMHGGSGLSKEALQTAIRNGIRKINYYTYMAMAGGAAIKEAMNQAKAEEPCLFHNIPPLAIQAMKADVAKAIDIFSLGL